MLSRQRFALMHHKTTKVQTETVHDIPKTLNGTKICRRIQVGFNRLSQTDNMLYHSHKLMAAHCKLTLCCHKVRLNARRMQNDDNFVIVNESAQ